jgi:crossover junction endodeoxyribonuclease RuvC
MLVYDDLGGKQIAEQDRIQWLREVLVGYEQRSVQVAIEMPPKAFKGPNGTSAIASLNENAGVWRGIVATLGYRWSYVAAISWKAHMGLRGSEKRDSLAVACREFPWAAGSFARVKDIGRADAALIALFAARRLQL